MLPLPRIRHCTQALALAEHAAVDLGAPARAALVERLQANADRAAALGLDEHMRVNIACAFLGDGGTCSVYSIRPSACRKHHSYDVTPCQTTFDDPSCTDQCPQSVERLAVAEGFTLSAGAAMREAGFDPLRYEMSGAVLEALTNRSSLKRWEGRERSASLAFGTVTRVSELRGQ